MRAWRQGLGRWSGAPTSGVKKVAWRLMACAPALQPPTPGRPAQRGREASKQLFGVVAEPFSAAPTCKQLDKYRHPLLVEVRP